jgi:RNA polymerase sigma factor (sigma-70 family)
MNTSTVEARRPHRTGYVAAAVMFGAGLAGMATAPSSAAADSRAINDISRYCTACWRNARLHPDSWSDCTQEVFCRLLRTVPNADWRQLLTAEDENRREFLRAIDAVKKRTQRARRNVQLTDDVPAPIGRQPEANEDRANVEEAAVGLLTARQSRILQLSLDGWSVQQIAQELAAPPARVSDEKYKAIRKLARHMTASGYFT